MIFTLGKRMALVPLDSPTRARHADGGNGSNCDMVAEFCPSCWPNVYPDYAKHVLKASA